jgi:Tfp pilus assembly protein FimV
MRMKTTVPGAGPLGRRVGYGGTACLLALAAGVDSQPVHGLGVGEAKPLSTLGQPLVLAVPLRTSDAASEVKARLVGITTPTDEIEDPEVLARLYRTSITVDAQGSPQVLVRSLARFTEPFLEVTIEITADGTRLQREFTVLVDPPGPDLGPPAVQLARRPPAAPVPRAVAEVARAPRVEKPRAARPQLVPQTALAAAWGAEDAEVKVAKVAAPQRKRAPAPAPKAPVERKLVVASLAFAANGARSHVVRRGECLGEIAGRLAQELGSDRKTIADLLYRENPHAFRGHPDLMLAGVTLRLPGAVQAVPPLHVAEVVQPAPQAVTPAEPAPPVVAEAPRASLHLVGRPGGPHAAGDGSLGSASLLPMGESFTPRAPKRVGMVSAPAAAVVAGGLGITSIVVIASVLSSVLTALLMLAGLLVLARRNKRI